MLFGNASHLLLSDPIDLPQIQQQKSPAPKPEQGFMFISTFSCVIVISPLPR